ncbi:hypothetical protein N9H34_00195 [bacterium]|nr:hypothetical protein [bacterium]
MKYNIYSPIGRTGSVRLVYILNWLFSHSGEDYFKKNGGRLHAALHLSETGTPGIVMHMINQGTLSKMPLPIIEKIQKRNKYNFSVTNHSYKFPESFYEFSKKNVSLHSHVCTWAANDDWTNILTTRKNKSELPMSLRIAERTGFWTGKDEIDDTRRTENSFYSERPFHFPVEEYIGNLDLLNLKEQMFIEGVKRDTGKHPIIMCLEDSYDAIETKLNLHIEENLRNELNTYKSKRRPKDYILNYDELIDAYNKYEYQPIERTK